MAYKIGQEWQYSKMGLKPIQKWETHKTSIGGCWAYKSGLTIFVWVPKVPSFGTLRWALKNMKLSKIV